MNPSNPGFERTVYDTANYYLNAGMPPNKMVLGQPTYGRSYVISEPMNNGLYCDSPHVMPPGPWTRTYGIYSYPEILKVQINDTLPQLPGATPLAWNTIVDTCHHTPYTYNG